MIDANKLAFKNLIEEYLKYNDVQIEDGRRYIRTETEIDKEWLKEVKKLEELIITPEIRLVHLEFNSESYIAIIGVNNLNTSLFDEDIFEYCEMNAGILTFLLSEKYTKIYKRTKHLEFYNNILFQHKEKGYTGHDYIEILDYIEPITLLKITDDFLIKHNILSRVACYIFSLNSSELILQFAPEVTEFISDLSLVGSDSIFYKLILNCLFSTSYYHAFLELYRLVERLFPITYLAEFHTKSNSQLSFLEFTSELENITSWRPNEEKAVEKIFVSSKKITTQYFQDFHDTSAEFKDHNHFNFFYQLRNSIVHFRASHSEISLEPKQWNLLFLATLVLIDEHYSTYNNILK